MDCMSKNNTNKLSNTREKKVGFGGASGKSFAAVGSERVFKQINGALDQSAVAVKIVPMLRAARDSGIQPQIFIRISVNAASVRRISAGAFTSANTLLTFSH